MEFRLLGALEISASGTLLQLNSPRQRIVLTVLLLEANRVVPLERLVAALWDDKPPVTAKNQVQTCISALRHQLAGAGAATVISTRAPGYLIRIPDGALDIVNFRQLVSQGRATADQQPEEAVRQLRAALALWRGPAAVGIESRVVQSIATRLNEEHLGMLEECIELELALGRHYELVGELSELIKQYPLRERIRAEHMLALYRSARQADALESFQEARQIFLDELGLEPAEELCALQRAILAKDRQLEVNREGPSGLSLLKAGAAMVPKQLPPAIADFTGRVDVIQSLTMLLSARDEEDGQIRYLPVVTLTGKGGVGKTALAVHVAHLVRDAYPDGQIFAQLKGSDGQPIGPMELLARFLRVLGLQRVSLPDNLTERTNVYRSRLGSGRVLIVLDDADNVSQVTPLIPGSPGCAVIITSRNPLSAVHGGNHLEIGDLDEETCLELLRRVIGAERVKAEESSALTLVRLCGCLPLALRIAAARLLARPHWTIDQLVLRMTDEDRRLDELALDNVGIRATMSLSYHSLRPDARRLFIRLCLLGSSEFASWVSAPLLDMSPDVAVDLLETLVDAHLVEVYNAEDGSPRFRLHELIRIYAMERLALDEPVEDRTRSLQRLLGCWLAVATMAHRRIYGGDFTVLHGNAPLWTLPDDVLDDVLGTPLAWFRSERAGLISAILQAGQAGLDEICWDLAVTSVTLFESEHLVEDWQRTHEVALEATRRAGNRRGEAAVLYSLGTLKTQQRLDDAARYLKRALSLFDQLGDTHGRALTQGVLGFTYRLVGDYERALLHYQEGLASSREVGDSVCEADALTNIAQIMMDREEYDKVEDFLGRAQMVCRSLKAQRPAAQTEYKFGEFFLRKGEMERAERSFTSVLQVSREHGDLVGETYALCSLGIIRTRQEQYALAEADLAAALNLARNLNDNLVHGRVLLASAELYLEGKDLRHATALVNEAVLVFSEMGSVPVWRARLLELKARIDDEGGYRAGAVAARGEAIALVGDRDSALARSLAEVIDSTDSPGRGPARGEPERRPDAFRSPYPHGGPASSGPSDEGTATVSDVVS
jgi:DNA-binding SARP family transcriptional activator